MIEDRRSPSWHRRSAIAVARVVIALALLLTWAAPSPGAAPSDTTTPWLGVTYIDRTEDLPRAIHLHVVQVDLGAPGIRFKLSPHAGPLEVVRQTTLEFLKQEHAQVAINAHFFWPWPSTEANSQVLGIAASDGAIYSSFEAPEQSYALLPDAPGLNIDRTNHASIVHDDRSQPDGIHTIEHVSLWTTVAGSAQIVTDGVATIPQYKDASHKNGALTPGGPSNFSNAHSWYEAVTARTAIGLSKDARTVTLLTVDVRGGSLGLSVGEAAALLIREFAVWNALNLDGGGSTSMAMEDPVSHEPRLVNTSSDNPAGRAVGSSLAVFARAR